MVTLGDSICMRASSWPSKPGDYRFIEYETGPVAHIVVSNIPHRLATEESGRSLLEMELKRAGISFDAAYFGENQKYGPAAESRSYRVRAMGLVKIEPDKKAATFHGRDHDYNIGVRPADLKYVRDANPEWKIVVKGSR